MLRSDRFWDSLASLRHKSLLRSPFYPGGEQALRYHHFMLKVAAQNGELRHFGDETCIRAFVLWWHIPHHPGFQAPYEPVIIAHDHSEAAKSWVCSCLEQVLDSLPPMAEIMLPVADLSTRTYLLERGFDLAAVDLAGKVKASLTGLRGKASTASHFEELGLQPRRATPADASKRVDLWEDVIGEDIRYAWFVNSGAYRKHRLEVLSKGQPNNIALVIYQGDELVGVASGTLRVPDVHHGTSIGMNVALAKSFRGMGLSRMAYGWVLGQAYGRRIDWVKGVTSRRAVLHLSREMRRGITGVRLRRSPYFDAAHFEPWLAQDTALARQGSESLT